MTASKLTNGGLLPGQLGLADAGPRLQGPIATPIAGPTEPAHPPIDGPQAVRTVHPTGPAPQEKNSRAEGKSPVGFAAHPERRWRGGGSKHARVRQMPKPPDWKPYHAKAKLSADDVQAIRLSVDGNERLADLFGVSVATIAQVRTGRRGKTLWRKPAPVDDQLSPVELADGLMKEIRRLSKTYRRALRRSMSRQGKLSTAVGRF